jgi:hypothetical protein
LRSPDQITAFTLQLCGQAGDHGLRQLSQHIVASAAGAAQGVFARRERRHNASSDRGPGRTVRAEAEEMDGIDLLSFGALPNI